MERHSENARELATWLDEHPAAETVHYPGLRTHPQHDLASRQMDEYGGMVSVEFDASLEEIREFVSNTEVFTLAESLGGVESLIEHPATMTHAAVPADERRKTGITDGLVRFSVGLEAVEDLRADLEQALAGSFGR
jgi:cystathionine gamma-synthase